MSEWGRVSVSEFDWVWVSEWVWVMLSECVSMWVCVCVCECVHEWVSVWVCDTLVWVAVATLYRIRITNGRPYWKLKMLKFSSEIFDLSSKLTKFSSKIFKILSAVPKEWMKSKGGGGGFSRISMVLISENQFEKWKGEGGINMISHFKSIFYVNWSLTLRQIGRNRGGGELVWMIFISFTKYYSFSRVKSISEII